MYVKNITVTKDWGIKHIKPFMISVYVQLENILKEKTYL